MKNPSCKDCECKSPLFHYLTTRELKLIDSVRYTVFYNPGETIFKQGTPATHVLSFTSGLAKATIETVNNNELILRLIKPSEFVAGPGLYVDNLHHYSIIALVPSRVCVIDKKVFLELLESNKIFARSYYEKVHRNYVMLINRLASVSYKQSRGKVAEVVVSLYKELGVNRKFQLPFSMGEMAAYAGVSKESVYKVLQEFALENLLRVTNREVELLEPGKLEEISLLG
ncbi:MAG: hypothetical protein Kow00127_05820 [Bacteroidales bacterium]